MAKLQTAAQKLATQNGRPWDEMGAYEKQEYIDAVRPSHRHKAEPGECVFCDREREASNDFHPSYDASDRCESGQHNHCSCDVCF